MLDFARLLDIGREPERKVRLRVLYGDPEVGNNHRYPPYRFGRNPGGIGDSSLFAPKARELYLPHPNRLWVERGYLVLKKG
jgi:hypothetical protein